MESASARNASAIFWRSASSSTHSAASVISSRRETFAVANASYSAISSSHRTIKSSAGESYVSTDNRTFAPFSENTTERESLSILLINGLNISIPSSRFHPVKSASAPSFRCIFSSTLMSKPSRCSNQTPNPTVKRTAEKHRRRLPPRWRAWNRPRIFSALLQIILDYRDYHDIL